MKFNIFVLFTFTFFINIFSQSTFFIKYKEDTPTDYINQVINFKNNIPINSKNPSIQNHISIEHFAKGLGKGNLSNILKLIIPDNIDSSFIFSLFENDPNIEYIQKQIIYKIDFIPDDSLFSEQWALNKINAINAWDLTQGADSIIIGVIDTGIDYLHYDLIRNIFINQGEDGNDLNGNSKRNNGIDDDNNGFIDDYFGWDFTDRTLIPLDSSIGDYKNWDNDPMDENIFSHGTSVAGIIAAQINNQIGIAGVAPNVKILNLRAFDSNGYGEEDDVASAILYAVEMGAKIINMSFGDISYSNVLQDVIKYAYSKNVVLIGSSGNSSSNEPHYPSGFSEVISVGNSMRDDKVAPSSNYGSTLDLVAPGTEIITTAKNNSYHLFSGTSASAPFVSSSAALILSLNNFSNEEVKQILKLNTDDVEETGWDLKSGAGRLNLFKSLSSITTTKIKFTSPLQNQTFSQDTIIPIKINLMSDIFNTYDLYIGEGLNPQTWTTLLLDINFYNINENIYELNTNNLKDTSYTLRLVVKNNNSETEERLNFTIKRNPIEIKLISLLPVYYGNQSTILASIFTNNSTIVKMYFKDYEEENYKSISLDNFSSNINYNSQNHFGFIPIEYSKPNKTYSIYFEIIETSGKKTILKDTFQPKADEPLVQNSDFKIMTNDNFNLIKLREKDFSLPPGSLFNSVVNFTSDKKNEIFFTPATNSFTTYLYKFENKSFIKLDSLNSRIPKDFGDFNNNEKKDLLTLWVRNTYIYEQDEFNSSVLVEKFKEDKKEFWPIMARDINSDGSSELLVLTNNSTIAIYKIENDFNLTYLTQLNNFSKSGFNKNIIDFPNALLVDYDNDGKNELFFVDSEGDIFSYKILSNNNITFDKEINTNFLSSSKYIATGNFINDDEPEFAVILKTNEEINPAKYNKLIIFNFKENKFNPIYEQYFIDPSSELSSTFQSDNNALKFIDIDKDGLDELILFLYPYSYILKNVNNRINIIHYDENIKSNSVFANDLDGNGFPEIAFPEKDKINFYEYENNEPIIYDLNGYSLNDSTIYIYWKGENGLYKIILNFEKNYFNDTILTQDNSIYYYSKLINDTINVKIFRVDSLNLQSIFLSTIKFYHHKQTKIYSIIPNPDHSLIINFTEKIKNPIIDLTSIKVLNKVENKIYYPKSIAVKNLYSYTLFFSEEIKNENNVLIIDNMIDFYSSPIKNDSINFNFPHIEYEKNFYITNYEIINPYLIKLTFNLNVDISSAMKTENYIFEPENKIFSIELNNKDSKSIFINLKNGYPIGSIGREYKLTLKNIYSSLNTGFTKINEDEGSSIIIKNFANDISDVYVYPNPVLVEHGKMTFANLPPIVEIIIWNINGKKIKTLKENVLSGGITWNLIDDNGYKLNTGVYIYRITQFDQNNNEIKSSLGKFSVVR
ncbi:MAG: hypothetical protein STSR0008_07730 [Ignavibacterium sp.]